MKLIYLISFTYLCIYSGHYFLCSRVCVFVFFLFYYLILFVKAPEIQTAALQALRRASSSFDYTTHRTLLLPRVLSLIANAGENRLYAFALGLKG